MNTYAFHPTKIDQLIWTSIVMQCDRQVSSKIFIGMVAVKLVIWALNLIEQHSKLHKTRISQSVSSFSYFPPCFEIYTYFNCKCLLLQTFYYILSIVHHKEQYKQLQCFWWGWWAEVSFPDRFVTYISDERRVSKKEVENQRSVLLCKLFFLQEKSRPSERIA